MDGKIGKSDWGAGKFLHQLLTENRLKALCGENTRVFMLTDDENLAAFCTLAELDDIRDISTGETGLYEKYGYSFYRMVKDMHGEDSRVYRREVC